MSQLTPEQRIRAYKSVLLVYLLLHKTVRGDGLCGSMNQYSLKVHKVHNKTTFPELRELESYNEHYPYWWTLYPHSKARQIRIAALRHCIKQLDPTYTPYKFWKALGVFLGTYIGWYLLFCIPFLYYTDDYQDILSTGCILSFYTIILGCWLPFYNTFRFWKKKRD